jgi:hypothetical protein
MTDQELRKGSVTNINRPSERLERLVVARKSDSRVVSSLRRVTQTAVEENYTHASPYADRQRAAREAVDQILTPRTSRLAAKSGFRALKMLGQTEGETSADLI